MLDTAIAFGFLCALILGGFPPAMQGIRGLQWPGAAFGIGGGLLLAIPSVHAAWGFLAFVVSNGAWIIFALSRRVWLLALQYLVLQLIAFFGLWNYWLGPLLLGGRA